MFGVLFARRAPEAFRPGAECLVAIAACLACAAASFAGEPTSAELLRRLERAERELANTQAEMDTLRLRDVQRQEWERSIARRLPPVDESSRRDESLFISASQGRAPKESAPDVPMELEQKIEQLGAAVKELGTGMEQMKGGVEELAANLRVTTLDPCIKIGIFGWLRGEMLLSDERPIIGSAPFFLSPEGGLDQSSVNVHGKSTAIGAGIEGPCVSDYQSGGLILMYFFGDTVLANSTGVFLAQGYGELKNDYHRVAFGVQSDIFNPRAPTMVNWAAGGAAGNAGFLRGQLRSEHYIKPSDTIQWTLTAGVSNPTPTNLSSFQEVQLAENNGWPNVEGRIALGLGYEYQDGMETRRPFEVGISALVGNVRITTISTDPMPVRTRVVDDVWAVGCDMRYAVTDRFGVQGELFTGKGLGTYAAGIAQVINLTTLNTIRTSGGWGEVYYYLTPCLHTHFGYGLDNPENDDLSTGQRTVNELIFGNLMWDVTSHFQVGFEVSHWKTGYNVDAPNFVLGGNEGMIYHVRLQYSF